MTRSVPNPCGRLTLPPAAAWAAHAAVEQLLRAAVEDETVENGRCEQLSRLLLDIETNGLVTAEELSLLRACCQDQLTASATTQDDHDALVVVIETVDSLLEGCPA